MLQVLVLTLGRLAVLLEGEEAFLGWILPLLQDADLSGAPPQVPACIVHVLATLAGVAARADSWCTVLYPAPAFPLLDCFVWGHAWKFGGRLLLESFLDKRGVVRNATWGWAPSCGV